MNSMYLDFANRVKGKLIEDFKRHYLKEIKNSFFKTEARKKRDKEKEYKRYEDVS